MKNVLLIGTVIIVLFSGVPVSEGKKKAAKDSAPAKESAPAKKAEESGQPAPAGWKDVTCSAPELVRVAYKFDGNYIIIRFQNISKEKMVRIKYQAKWKKNENGKWVDDASSEGLTIRLRKQEELTKEVRTRSKDIKDVVIDIDASEVS